MVTTTGTRQSALHERTSIAASWVASEKEIEGNWQIKDASKPCSKSQQAIKATVLDSPGITYSSRGTPLLEYPSVAQLAIMLISGAILNHRLSVEERNDGDEVRKSKSTLGKYEKWSTRK